jgi:hypothetical protein
MPVPGVALERLGFLTIGLFDESDPARGHRTTPEIIELGDPAASGPAIPR